MVYYIEDNSLELRYSLCVSLSGCNRRRSHLFEALEPARLVYCRRYFFLLHQTVPRQEQQQQQKRERDMQQPRLSCSTEKKERRAKASSSSTLYQRSSILIHSHIWSTLLQCIERAKRSQLLAVLSLFLLRFLLLTNVYRTYLIYSNSSSIFLSLYSFQQISQETLGRRGGNNNGIGKEKKSNIIE